MEKPNNYDETKEQGTFTPIDLGGHTLVIKSVEERTSKTGKPMIVVFFDCSIQDKQAGYFADMYKNDTREEKKWPHQATQYILRDDAEGNCNRTFKTFITCVEHSNNGFNVQWGADFGKQFKNKIIGGVFGLQADYYNGKEIEKRVLRWFVSAAKVDEAVIPDPVETKAYREHLTMFQTNDNGFLDIPSDIDEELPFK